MLRYLTPYTFPYHVTKLSSFIFHDKHIGKSFLKQVTMKTIRKLIYFHSKHENPDIFLLLPSKPSDSGYVSDILQCKSYLVVIFWPDRIVIRFLSYNLTFVTVNIIYFGGRFILSRVLVNYLAICGYPLSHMPNNFQCQLMFIPASCPLPFPSTQPPTTLISII